jgi:hypothetical protein
MAVQKLRGKEITPLLGAGSFIGYDLVVAKIRIFNPFQNPPRCFVFIEKERSQPPFAY